MIVAETKDGHLLVTQPDHATMAGQFADHWGNDSFDPPEPSPSVAIAAYTHDGWWDRDRRPRRSDDDTPEEFTEISSEPWISLYDEGIDAAIELDRYAGLLVSMHGVGLRKQGYGLSPSWPTTPSAYASFVERHEERQRSIARELFEEPDGPIDERDVEVLTALHESGAAPTELESRLWRNYELLQALDTLSLSFYESVSPPAYESVGSVPTGEPGDGVTLSITPLDDGSFAVEPYPFNVDGEYSRTRMRSYGRFTTRRLSMRRSSFDHRRRRRDSSVEGNVESTRPQSSRSRPTGLGTALFGAHLRVLPDVPPAPIVFRRRRSGTNCERH